MHITYLHNDVSYPAHMHEPLLSISRIRVTSVYYKRILLCMTMMTVYTHESFSSHTELWHCFMFLLVSFSGIRVVFGLLFSEDVESMHFYHGVVGADLLVHISILEFMLIVFNLIHCMIHLFPRSVLIESMIPRHNSRVISPKHFTISSMMLTFASRLGCLGQARLHTRANPSKAQL